MTTKKKKDRYSEAGVDIDAGNRFVKLIKPIVAKTFKSNVITDIGGFAGLFSLQSQDMKNPILVASTDATALFSLAPCSSICWLSRRSDCWSYLRLF